jgi:hypothetical protein
MSAVGKFLQSPLGFLEQNILVVGWEGRPEDNLGGRTDEMTFMTKPRTTALARKMGIDLGLYFVVPAAMANALPTMTPDGRTFDAYFCSYQQNQTYGITLGKDADFMFTATMDGCSLGIGNANPDGSQLVYHSNLGGRSEEQRLVLGLVLGLSLGHVFEPSSYRFEYGQGVRKSTTMGIRSRTSNSWSFYAQIYFEDATVTPRKYFLREVKDID